MLDKIVRESLKQKLLAAKPYEVIEVDDYELQFVMSEGAGDLMREVDQIQAERKAKDKADVVRNEEGLASMAGVREPDCKAQDVTFEEVVKPVMEYMANHACPHSHIVISSVSAELFHGTKSFNSFEFVRD